MAITVATHAEATDSDTTLTITKPTGLAVGDLMVALLGSQRSGSTSTSQPSTLAGWTALDGEGWYHTGDNVCIFQGVQWKVAEAADVAASNFTFTFSANAAIRGSILRITGARPTTEITYDYDRTGNDGYDTGSSGSFACGVAPALAESLLVIAVNSYNGSTFAGYAVATSNPASWTEQYDGDSRAVATAVRTQTTNTGNIAVTYATGDHAYIVHFLAISPAFGVTVSATYGKIILKGIAPTIKFGVKVLATYAKMVLKGMIPTIRKGLSWTQNSKNAATWTNRSKNATTWTDKTKNTTTWTNKDKSSYE